MPAEGLRHRKKLKARIAVERAALELVIERGYDRVTVEDICARAEISKKTFFNYFPSKASAITGRTAPFPDAERVEELLEGCGERCYVDVLVEVVGSRLAPVPADDIAQLRRAALEAMPQLFFQGQRDVPEMQRALAEALTSYLGKHPDRRLLADRPVRQEVLVASSAVIGVARTRSMLKTCDDAEPSAEETRRLLAAYLSAGEAPVSNPTSREAS